MVQHRGRGRTGLRKGEARRAVIDLAHRRVVRVRRHDRAGAVGEVAVARGRRRAAEAAEDDEVDVGRADAEHRRVEVVLQEVARADEEPAARRRQQQRVVGLEADAGDVDVAAADVAVEVEDAAGHEGDVAGRDALGAEKAGRAQADVAGDVEGDPAGDVVGRVVQADVAAVDRADWTGRLRRRPG